MKDTLRERRIETFNMLYELGLPYRQVVNRLSQKYDRSPSTLETDISRMSNWIDKIDEIDKSAVDPILKEYKRNRQKKQQLIHEIRNSDDDDLSDYAKTEFELEARKQIDESIEGEISLKQSVGYIEKEPEKADVTLQKGEPVHDFRNESTLTETQQKHFEALTEGVEPEEIPVEAVSADANADADPETDND